MVAGDLNRRLPNDVYIFYLLHSAEALLQALDDSEEALLLGAFRFVGLFLHSINALLQGLRASGSRSGRGRGGGRGSGHSGSGHSSSRW